ncbi:hypothetical protein RM780_25415 [Streptomyces sp. DSM 44917]|uniref:HTH cro/C1-type domain-containing protein n=1 Tax=Streptomyces boetiae TaxID=3075541 RepID=A0ABU2LFB0_9ACTN|nr:helix-turn-helix domain-containing protein [Streptomyces sp. DSM 44917]MDT0310266.1 hypothetical protein [Streptomyces sp. DSM 44917]
MAVREAEEVARQAAEQARPCADCGQPQAGGLCTLCASARATLEQAAPFPELAERERLRKAVGLTRAAVGRALGVSSADVAGWETGRSASPGERRAVYACLFQGLAARYPAPASAPAAPQVSTSPRRGREGAAQASPEAAPGADTAGGGDVQELGCRGRPGACGTGIGGRGGGDHHDVVVAASGYVPCREGLGGGRRRGRGAGWAVPRRAVGRAGRCWDR